MLNKIKARRFISGKTQDQVFLETGIFPSKLSRIERGFVTPSEEEKKKIADVLATTIQELFPES